jgi:Fe-S cluster assembly protein SufD
MSELKVKSVLGKNAHLTCDTIIYVAPNIEKIEADQLNKNLTLDETAHVMATPQLEILSNDVKCHHGSASGQLDNEKLFYLASRGLTQKEAQRSLIEAFLT